MATLPAPERSRLERVSENGTYRGKLKVRVIAPGVCGDQLDAPDYVAQKGAPLRNRGWLCSHVGCPNRRSPGSSICASHAARKKGPNLCSLCGALGHNVRSCEDSR